MNHFSLTILALTLISSSSFAGLQIAPTLGYRSNTAVVEDGGSLSYSSNPDFQVGVLVYYSFLDTLALRTGLIHSGLGMKGTTTSEFKDKITYWDIPLNLQFDLPISGLYVFGGMIYGIKDTSSCETSSGGACSTDRSSTNTRLNAGIGYEIIETTVLKLGVDLSYEHGTTNINSTASSSTKIYTRSYVAGANVRIGF